MTINEAINFFESLTTKATKKAEIKVYEDSKQMLSKLKDRSFSKDEIQAIETELESLNLNSNNKNNIKFFKKALSKFETFLRNTFALTTEGYYTKLYGGLGLSFGLLFGIVFLSSWDRSGGISLGLIGGMFVGSIIGHSMDTKAKSENRIL